MVGDRGSVLGNCRVYVKKMLKQVSFHLTLKSVPVSCRYVPILGWAWGLSDTIFLERNWEKDQVFFEKFVPDLYS